VHALVADTNSSVWPNRTERSSLVMYFSTEHPNRVHSFPVGSLRVSMRFL